MIVAGLVHDHCSAVHPLAAGSPFLAELDLASDGLTWLHPEVDCAHPLDDGSAGVLYRSIERTAEALGSDGQRWRRVFEPMASHFDALFADASQPVLRVPRHPLTLARFGAGAMLPATTLARAWRTEEAKALWAGVAAHAFSRLDRPMTSAVGLMLIVAAHAKGWVVAEGGSRAIAEGLGGRHRTPRRQDRDRCARDLGRRPPAERRVDAGRVAVDRRRNSGRSATGSRRPLVPPVPSRPRRVQGRFRDRGRRSVDGPGGTPSRHRPSQ